MCLLSPGAPLQISLPFLPPLKLSGQFAFLVWKSVYLTKQVRLLSLLWPACLRC